MNAAAPKFLNAGESALVIEFGTIIDPDIHDRVLALDAAIARANIPGIVETVPTFRSIMVHFDPRIVGDNLADQIAALSSEPAATEAKRRRWLIPVCYDAPHGEDIAEAADVMGLTPQRLIELHSSALYRVYMYGFAPGYTFLGGLSPILNISRRLTPRSPSPAGALMIAGGQALITSFVMPTGWYVLGQTPVRMFEPKREPAFLAGIGDEVVFEIIDSATFAALDAQAAEGAAIARDVTPP